MSVFEITEDIYPVKLQLAYATSNNFLNKKLYKNARCYLSIQVKDNFEHAIKLADKLGYKLKIFDCYRPVSVQQEFYDFVRDENYVANPKKIGGGSHNRGVAIDLTLLDQQNNEVDMGADFDEFRSIAHQGNTEISAEALKNRSILNGIMTASGFELLMTEWWHFQMPDFMNYDVIDHDSHNLGMI